MTEIATKIVVDCSTGEQRIENLTEAEIAQREADAEAYAIAQAEQAAAEAQVAADKADAIAALVALGLTEAQIAALTK